MRIRKSTLKKIIAEVARPLNEGMHPYDAGINQALDVGFYSNSDAIGEIEGDLMRVRLSRTDDVTITITYGSSSRPVTFEGNSPEEAADKADAFEEEWEELMYSVEGDYNDDANDLMDYIPKEVKDMLPVQEFDDGMDDDY